MEEKKTSKLKILLFPTALIMAVFFFALIFKTYPIATVNGKIVWGYNYYKTYEFAYKYYDYLNKNDLKPINQDILVEKLKRATFESMVDNVLVKEKLASEMNQNELEDKINMKIEEMTKDKELEKIVKESIGVSPSDFRKYFLENQAKYQILDGRLQLENKNLVSWLLEERKVASVRSLLPSIKWIDNKAEIVK